MNLLPEEPIIVLPTLARIFGVDEAMLLQELANWIDQEGHITEDGSVQVHDVQRNLAGLHRLIDIAPRSTSIRKLIRQGVVVLHVTPNNQHWYQIDYTVLDRIVQGWKQQQAPEDRPGTEL
jgi:hypothetical protein